MNRSSDPRRRNKTQTNDSYEFVGENTFRYTMAAETSCEETSLIERLQVLGTVKTTTDDGDSSLDLPHKSRVSVHLPLVVSRARSSVRVACWSSVVYSRSKWTSKRPVTTTKYCYPLVWGLFPCVSVGEEREDNVWLNLNLVELSGESLSTSSVTFIIQYDKSVVYVLLVHNKFCYL